MALLSFRVGVGRSAVVALRALFFLAAAQEVIKNPDAVAKAVDTVVDTTKGIVKTVTDALGITGGASSAVAAAAPTAAPVAAAPLAPAAASAPPTMATGSAAGGIGIVGQVVIGLAPLAFIALIANAWGVFDEWDPNAGFQTMRGYDGNIYKVPDAIFDQVAREGHDGAFRSWIEQQKQNIEAQQAAKQYIQAADVAGVTLTQEVKKAVAKKASGNAGTQFN